MIRYTLCNLKALVELSIARIIRHGHPNEYPYGYSGKWSQGKDIPMDVYNSCPFIWISIRISVRMAVSKYPYYRQFDQEGRKAQTEVDESFELAGKDCHYRRTLARYL